ncbi:MAG TPA: hypothetical protein PKI55_06280 [Chitinophagaceae bacterium]|nr:hypothetical protein [Chitinophagaceae bacterium]
MQEYNIKITGSGTRQDIAKALRLIADAIYHPHSKGDGLNIEDIDGAQWEDSTLMTEIYLNP